MWMEKPSVSVESHQPVCRVGSERSNVRNRYALSGPMWMKKPNVSGESHQPVCRVGSERSNVRNQYCGLIGWVGLL